MSDEDINFSYTEFMKAISDGQIPLEDEHDIVPWEDEDTQFVLHGPDQPEEKQADDHDAQLDIDAFINSIIPQAQENKQQQELFCKPKKVIKKTTVTRRGRKRKEGSPERDVATIKKNSIRVSIGYPGEHTKRGFMNRAVKQHHSGKNAWKANILTISCNTDCCEHDYRAMSQAMTSLCDSLKLFFKDNKQIVLPDCFDLDFLKDE